MMVGFTQVCIYRHMLNIYGVDSIPIFQTKSKYTVHIPLYEWV